MQRFKNATVGFLTFALVTLGATLQASADNLCDTDADHTCVFDISELEIQDVPSVFRFQSRVSQAKFPVGNASFSTLLVQVEKADGEVLCQEQFSDVQVRDSVLNLEVGRLMSCQLSEMIRQHNDLKFTVCFGGDQCLKPISMGAVPYSVKSTYAKQAQQSYKAQEAAQAHYAHRITADKTMFTSGTVSKGYFDFHTPAAAMQSLYSTADFSPYSNDGFIEWAQVMSPTGVSSSTFSDFSRLHLCSKDLNTNIVKSLDELLVHAKTSQFNGKVVVSGEASDGVSVFVKDPLLPNYDPLLANPEVQPSLTVWYGADVGTNLNVYGTSTTVDTATFEQDIMVMNGANITNTADDIAALQVSSGSLLRDGVEADGGMVVAGGTHLYSTTAVTDSDSYDEATDVGLGLIVNEGAKVIGDHAVTGDVSAANAVVTGTVSSAVASTGTLTVSGTGDVTQTLSVGGQANLNGGLAVAGSSSMVGDVSVSGGSLTVGGNMTVPSSGNISMGADGSTMTVHGNVSFTGDVSFSSEGSPSVRPADGSISESSQFAGSPIGADQINWTTLFMSNSSSALQVNKQLSVNGRTSFETDGRIINDHSNGSYDVWLQGGSTSASGHSRNLALLGHSSEDKLYLNYGSEYLAGVRIGGPFQMIHKNNNHENMGGFYANNMTQGVGFRYNYVEATGTNANVEINMAPKGTSDLNLRDGALRRRMIIQKEGGVYLRDNGEANRLEVADNNFRIRDPDSQERISINSNDYLILRDGNGRNRVDVRNDHLRLRDPDEQERISIYNEGNLHLRDRYARDRLRVETDHFYIFEPDGHQRISVYSNSHLILRDKNQRQRFTIHNNGNLYVYDQHERQRMYVDDNNMYLRDRHNIVRYGYDDSNTFIRHRSGHNGIVLWNNNDNFAVYNRNAGRTNMIVKHTNGTRYASYDGDSNWDFYSDRRLKENIVEEENILDRISSLNVVQYNFKNEGPEFTEIGLIAQEVEKVFPEVVTEAADKRYDFKVKTLGYSTIGVLAAGAVKELRQEKDAEIEVLQRQLAELEEQNAKMEQEVDSLEAENETLSGRLSRIENLLKRLLRQ